MPRHLRLVAGTASHGSRRPARIEVIVADDHALMRRGLRQVLDGESGIEVVAEADDLAAASDHARRVRPHVLVLDLGMCRASSLRTLGELRERLADTRIVVVTMDENAVLAQRALAAGAHAFVCKSRADTDLPAAVHAAAGDQEYLSPTVATRQVAPRRSLPDYDAAR